MFFEDALRQTMALKYILKNNVSCRPSYWQASASAYCRLLSFSMFSYLCILSPSPSRWSPWPTLKKTHFLCLCLLLCWMVTCFVSARYYIIACTFFITSTFLRRNPAKIWRVNRTLYVKRGNWNLSLKSTEKSNRAFSATPCKMVAYVAINGESNRFFAKVLCKKIIFML